MDATKVLVLAFSVLLVLAGIVNLVLVVRRMRRPAGTPSPTIAPVRPQAPAVPLDEPPAPEPRQPEPEVPQPAPSPPAKRAVTAPAAPVPADHIKRDPAPRAPIHPAGERHTPSVPNRSTVPHYTPVAPVELRFGAEKARIGVTRGSDAHLEFSRLADDLLTELRRAREQRRGE